MQKATLGSYLMEPWILATIALFIICLVVYINAGRENGFWKVTRVVGIVLGIAVAVTWLFTVVITNDFCGFFCTI